MNLDKQKSRHERQAFIVYELESNGVLLMGFWIYIFECVKEAQLPSV